MRIILLFIGLCTMQIMASAQISTLNNALKMKTRFNPSSELITVLVEGNSSALKDFPDSENYHFRYASGKIASIQCDVNTLAQLIETKIISYAELGSSHAQVLNDTMLLRNRIQAIHQGLFPLAKAYDGDSIVIGIIDTGIDFSHPDFKDNQGKSRIQFIWDQVPVAGSNVPQPYGYGIEWTKTQIDSNLCTHSDLAYYGHGTYVAGIAAGNGMATGHFSGVAPKADLVVVALDFNNTGPSIADAVSYIFSKATLLGKPCVINASLGDYYGSHDGTNLEAQLIDNMVSGIPGRAMVAASGNAGNYKFHVKTQTTVSDTVFTWLNNGGTNIEYWLYADTLQIKNLNYSIAANRSNFSDLGRIGFRNYSDALNTPKSDTLKHNGNRIGIVHTSASINNSGVYELYVEIVADTTNLNWRVESTGNALHHAWNFDFVSDNLPSVSQYPDIVNYQAPDTMYTMVSSFQCSDEIITVGNYFNLRKYYDVNDTLRDIGFEAGSIAQNSSSGPTRDGRQKPDITASGNYIFSAIPLGMQAAQIAAEPSAVAQGSFHIRGGGTSAASPVVAGLAALYLQAHPNATNLQIKNAIINCAYNDAFTGTQLPNYLWGYGKLDGKAAMVCGENLVGLESTDKYREVNVYPNPFKDQFQFNFTEKINAQLFIYNVEGKLIFQDQFLSNHYQLPLGALSNQNKGLLLVRIASSEENYCLKLIKE